MKVCPWCSNEIPESATSCSHCAPQAVAPDSLGPELVTPVEAVADQSGAAAAPAVVASKPAGDRRKLFAIVMTIAGGGTITLAMMMGSGASLPEAVRSNVRTLDLPEAAPAAAAAVTHTRKWSSANRDWVGNERKAVAFELLSESKVPIWQRQAQPILVIRCVSNRTEAFVFIESAAQMELQDQNHAVRIAFDDGPETTERWPDSDEHDALFAPDGAAFARRLTTARTMRFGYTPHNASLVTTSFNVAGLDTLIQPVAKQCGWQ